MLYIYLYARHALVQAFPCYYSADVRIFFLPLDVKKHTRKIRVLAQQLKASYTSSLRQFFFVWDVEKHTRKIRVLAQLLVMLVAVDAADLNRPVVD